MMSLRFRTIVFGVLFFLVSSFQFPVFSADSGSSDDKIGDMIEDIKKKEKEQKEKEKEDQQKKKKENEDDSDGSCFGALFSGCVRGCFDVGFQILAAAAMLIDYSDYPYADSNDFVFSKFKSDPEESGKIGFLKLTYEPAYLTDDTWSMSGRIEGALTAFYVNCIYQYNFSLINNFSTLSVNAGIQIPISNVALRLFAGGFSLPGILESTLFSFGGGLEIFFPYNIIFEIYSLNALADNLGFFVVSPSLSIALWRFNIGVGYTYYNYAGTEYMGPQLKLSFWI